MNDSYSRLNFVFQIFDAILKCRVYEIIRFPQPVFMESKLIAQGFNRRVDDKNGIATITDDTVSRRRERPLALVNMRRLLSEHYPQAGFKPISWLRNEY